MDNTSVTTSALTVLADKLRNGTVEERRVAVKKVGRMGNVGATDTVQATLVFKLNDEDSQVRDEAVSILLYMNRASAADAVLTALIDRLEDQDKLLQFMVVEALGLMGIAMASDVVLTTLEYRLGNIDKGGQEKTARGPGTGNAVAEPDALARALKDADRHVQWRAAYELGAMRGAAVSDALAALVERLEDPDSVLRWNAAQVLGRMGSAAATDAVLNALIGRLQDEVDYVRRKAGEAIVNLTASGFRIFESQSGTWERKSVKTLSGEA